MKNEYVEAVKSLLLEEIREPDQEFLYFLDEYTAGLNLNLSKEDARIKAFKVTMSRFPKRIERNSENLGRLNQFKTEKDGGDK